MKTRVVLLLTSKWSLLHRVLIPQLIEGTYKELTSTSKPDTSAQGIIVTKTREGLPWKWSDMLECHLCAAKNSSNKKKKKKKHQPSPLSVCAGHWRKGIVESDAAGVYLKACMKEVVWSRTADGELSSKHSSFEYSTCSPADISLKHSRAIRSNTLKADTAKLSKSSGRCSEESL